jgi:hypothetical protein
MPTFDPSKITKEDWLEIENLQKKGKMNMLGQTEILTSRLRIIKCGHGGIPSGIIFNDIDNDKEDGLLFSDEDVSKNINSAK